MVKINDYVMSMAKKFILVIFGVLGTACLNRYLGPELRGSFAYMTNILSVSNAVLNLGIQQTFTIELRKNPENYENLKDAYMNMFFLQFVIYMLFIGVLFVFSGAKFENFYWFIIPIYTLLGQCNYLLLSKHFTYRGVLFILNSLVQFLIYLLLFIFAQKNVYLVMLLNGILYILFLWAGLFKLKPRIDFRKIDFRYFGYLLKIAFFPLCISFLNTINYNIDIIFLEKYVSLTDVGLYSVAVGLANYVWLFPEIFSEVILSRASTGDAIESVKQSLRFSTTIVIFVIIAIIVFGKLAINILYGEAYVESYYITLVLMGGVPVMSFFKIVSPYILSTGKTYVNFIILLISAIVNVFLNMILIPIWGTYGAGIASVFSYCVCGFAFFIYFAKTENINIKEILLINKKDIAVIKNTVLKLIKKS